MIWVLVVICFPLTHASLQGQEYLFKGIAWLSQGINWFFLGGHHDQTVSARAYVNRNDPMWAVVYRTINAIFFWQGDHCLQSHLEDMAFAKQVYKWTR